MLCQRAEFMAHRKVKNPEQLPAKGGSENTREVPFQHPFQKTETKPFVAHVHCPGPTQSRMETWLRRMGGGPWRHKEKEGHGDTPNPHHTTHCITHSKHKVRAEPQRLRGDPGRSGISHAAASAGSLQTQHLPA